MLLSSARTSNNVEIDETIDKRDTKARFRGRTFRELNLIRIN